MGPVASFLRFIFSLMGRFWWLFPLALVAGGYAVPDLRANVAGAMPERLFTWLFGELVLCGVWLVAAFFHASSGNTAVSELKLDNLVSSALALVLAMTSSYMFAKGQLSWLFVLPTVTAVVDCFVTGDRAINNAAMKPLVQQQTSKA